MDVAASHFVGVLVLRAACVSVWHLAMYYLVPRFVYAQLERKSREDE